MLLAKALAAVVIARVQLRIAPFAQALERTRQLCPTPHRSESPRELAIRVAQAARFVPGARCLAQGVALHALLDRSGQPSQLRLGVLKDGPDTLVAHCWVELDGDVLLGDDGRLPSYTVIAHEAHDLSQ